MSRKKFSLVDELKKVKAPAPVVCGEPRADAGFCFGEEAGTQSTGWPMYSDALKVHPHDAAEAVQQAVDLGVPTEFNKKGQPKFESQGHRKRYCEALGYYDRNGSYGDPQRK